MDNFPDALSELELGIEIPNKNLEVKEVFQKEITKYREKRKEIDVWKILEENSRNLLRGKIDSQNIGEERVINEESSKLNKGQILSTVLGIEDKAVLAKVMDDSQRLEFVALCLERQLISPEKFKGILNFDHSDLASINTLIKINTPIDAYLGIQIKNLLQLSDIKEINKTKAILKDYLDLSTVKSLIEEPEKREFLGVLSSLVKGADYQDLVLGFSSLYEKKEEIVYLTHLLTRGRLRDLTLGKEVSKFLAVKDLLKHQMVDQFINPECIKFIENLSNNLDYRISIYDMSHGLVVQIFENFQNRETLQDDLVIKTINNLNKVGYTFDLQRFKELDLIFKSDNLSRVNLVAQIFGDHFSHIRFVTQEGLEQIYSLSLIPDIVERLNLAVKILDPNVFKSKRMLKLFFYLGAEPILFSKADKLLDSDHFNRGKDAALRRGRFLEEVLIGDYPEGVVSTIFAVSSKSVELDRLIQKVRGINDLIKKREIKNDWWRGFMETKNFDQAYEFLVKIRADLLLPVVYSNLDEIELVNKKNSLLERAQRDPIFEEVLNINFGAVATYNEKYKLRDQYPDYKKKFDELMIAVRRAIDLNDSSGNKDQYMNNRMVESLQQFYVLFEGVEEGVKDRILKMWKDTNKRKKIYLRDRRHAEVEEIVGPLYEVRQIVENDLTIHLPDLFKAKIKDMRSLIEQGKGTHLLESQLNVYERFLLNDEGEIKKDLPIVYKNLMEVVSQAKFQLKDPNFPKEEKQQLAKNLGQYQALVSVVKAFYRLHTINEKRFNGRKNYVGELNQEISDFSAGLKKLKIVDPEKRAENEELRLLENDVLTDLNNIKTIIQKNRIEGLVTVEIDTTIDFNTMAKAPNLTDSCQRIDISTDYNQSAYSRLLDGVDEMVELYTLVDGEKKMLGRSFIELSKIKKGEEETFVILADRLFVDPQLVGLGGVFTNTIMDYLLDRVESTPEVKIMFYKNKFDPYSDRLEDRLKEKGFKLTKVRGDYLINKSAVSEKYYDAFNGNKNVDQVYYHSFDGDYYLIEELDDDEEIIEIEKPVRIGRVGGFLGRIRGHNN